MPRPRQLLLALSTLSALSASFGPFALFALSALACSDPHPPHAHAPTLTLTCLPSPTPPNSGLPNFATDRAHSAYLTWVTDPTTPSLHVARLTSTTFTTPHKIAEGTDWFVNWADFPAFAATDSQHLLASFLQRTGGNSYDYRVRITQSSDSGATWSPPITLHTDTKPGEHGFVSLEALDARTFAAVWLDSRNLQGGEHGAHMGAMSLYFRTIDTQGALGPEIALDERVCDCCQTALAVTESGASLVAYRDRSRDEVRDISVVRVERDGAQRTVFASADGWKIAGCPVNGPALDVDEMRVGLTWFTLGNDGLGRVLCTLSDDEGKTFGAPITIVSGNTQGRVDAVFDSDGALIVTWLDADESGARWRVARVSDPSTTIEPATIAETSSARASGFGRLARDANSVVFAYTKTSEPTTVEVVRLTWQ